MVPPDLDKTYFVPVDRLAHITHKEEAKIIAEVDRQHHYFVAAPKVGKEYNWDGSPIGESYVATTSGQHAVSEEDTYKKVPQTSSLLPGYYSWWGVTTREWLKGDSEAAQRMRRATSGLYVADYLKSPPQSRYGSKEFSVNLADAIKCYQSSRKSTDVYMKLTGTLRYKKEICYVITVCTSSDDEITEKSEYGDLKEATEVFTDNGMLDEDGKVVDHNAVPHFYPRHINTSNSWANLTFAFYFPNEDQVLVCPKSSIRRKPISHKGKGKCIKTQPSCGTDWKCPNYLDPGHPYKVRIKHKLKRLQDKHAHKPKKF